MMVKIRDRLSFVCPHSDPDAAFDPGDLEYSEIYRVNPLLPLHPPLHPRGMRGVPLAIHYRGFFARSFASFPLFAFRQGTEPRLRFPRVSAACVLGAGGRPYIDQEQRYATNAHATSCCVRAPFE